MAGSATTIANISIMPTSVANPIAIAIANLRSGRRSSRTRYARLSASISARAELRAENTAMRMLRPTCSPRVPRECCAWLTS